MSFVMYSPGAFNLTSGVGGIEYAEKRLEGKLVIASRLASHFKPSIRSGICALEGRIGKIAAGEGRVG